MPLNDIALSTAVFLFYGVDEPYGKYEDGLIVTNTGWPDFCFPDLVLDRSQTYEFEATFFGGEGLIWMYAGSDDDLPGAYQDFTSAFTYGLGSASGEIVSWTVSPGDWGDVPEGFNTPWFEIHYTSALASLRYTGDAIVGPPPTYESGHLDGRAAFAT